MATDIILEIERTITCGTVIPKPDARREFIVKGWGSRRSERALIYTIPNHNDPAKPFEKGITISEWRQTASHLMESGSFSRPWFEHSMPACSKEGGCNFSTIGGVFELLGYATRERRGVYRRTGSMEPL